MNSFSNKPATKGQIRYGSTHMMHVAKIIERESRMMAGGGGTHV